MPEDKPPSQSAQASPPAAAADAKAASPQAGGSARPAGQAPSQGVTRRRFLSSLGLAWSAFTAAMAACSAGMARFMFPNVLYEPPWSFKAGWPEEYTLGVDERWKARFGAWIVRDEKGFYAVKAVCTHLGCTPNWLAVEEKFKCPCHGSGFYVSGINFEGPAPRPLERYRIALADDGQILVDRSKIYQQELAQWSDPESFLEYTA